MRTFLDSGVLIAAFQATKKESAAALAVLDDDRREFLTCDVVKLEVLPKPVFFKHKDEREFYEEIFARSESAPVTEALYAAAFDLATRYGLSAGDAFNLAAALDLGADEFVTTESSGKPMFRVKGLRVVSLHAAASSK